MSSSSKQLNLRGLWEPLNLQPIGQKFRWLGTLEFISGICSEVTHVGDCTLKLVESAN